MKDHVEVKKEVLLPYDEVPINDFLTEVKEVGNGMIDAQIYFDYDCIVLKGYRPMTERELETARRRRERQKEIARKQQELLEAKERKELERLKEKYG